MYLSLSPGVATSAKKPEHYMTVSCSLTFSFRVCCSRTCGDQRKEQTSSRRERCKTPVLRYVFRKTWVFKGCCLCKVVFLHFYRGCCRQRKSQNYSSQESFRYSLWHDWNVMLSVLEMQFILLKSVCKQLPRQMAVATKKRQTSNNLRSCKQSDTDTEQVKWIQESNERVMRHNVTTIHNLTISQQNYNFTTYSMEWCYPMLSILSIITFLSIS